MLDSIFINKDALQLMALENVNKCIQEYVRTIGESNFDKIDELCKLLKPLNGSTEVLSGSKYRTISLLFPFVYSLIAVDLDLLVIVDSDIQVIRKELISSVRGRLLYIIQSSHIT
jgi:hypothetical protein